MKLFNHKYLLLIVACSLALMSFKHAFYASVCEIEHNARAKTLEISVKIFVDDLEAALKDEGTGALYFGEPREHEKADEYVHNYLKNHLSITVNKKAKNFTYIGKEMDNDALWVYMEVPKVGRLKTLTLDNRILVDKYDKQRNIVHIKKGNIKKNMLLSKSKTEDTVSF